MTELKRLFKNQFACVSHPWEIQQQEATLTSCPTNHVHLETGNRIVIRKDDLSISLFTETTQIYLDKNERPPVLGTTKSPKDSVEKVLIFKFALELVGYKINLQEYPDCYNIVITSVPATK